MDRQIVESQTKIPNYMKNDSRRRQLFIWDRWLDGDIYDDISTPFHKDSAPGGGFISMEKRRPNAKFRLPALAARQIARKLFAGRHAPVFTSPEAPETAKAVKDLADISGLNDVMMRATQYGQVGSVCVTFKFLHDVEDNLKLITDVFRSRDCWPIFDATRDLAKLRICQVTTGSYFISFGLNFDAASQPIKPDGQYWFIRELNRQEEIHYYPVLFKLWKPDGSAENEAKLKAVDDGEFKTVQHKLGFVPAQWFINLNGGVFPDGICTFKDALDNLVAYDYTTSQLGMGINNSATPHVVMKGSPVQQNDAEGKPIPWSPTRFLQFPTDQETDNFKQGGGDAHLLEPTGQGMSVGIRDYLRLLKKDAIEMLCMSRKDPDKITTAMSGKGIELIEEEFMDFVMELRNCYLSNGYLPLIRKIVKAAIKAKHPMFNESMLATLDKLGLDFPQLHDMSPQEYQLFMTALVQGVESGILDGGDAFDLHEAQVDAASHSTRDEVTARVEKFRAEGLQPKQPLNPNSKSIPKENK